MDPPEPTVAPSPDFNGRYEKVAPALCAWATRHVSQTVRARVEVDDLLQEVWLRAFRIRDQFRGDDSAFRAWLFAIAKLVLLEVQRSVRRAQRVRIDDGHTTRVFDRDQVAAHVTALSQRLLRDEAIRRFCDHLRSLSREDQDLISFCGLEGSTCAEAARKLGIGVDAAIKRWQRLRTRLRAEGLAHDWLV